MKCPRCVKVMTEGIDGAKCQKCGYINKPRGKIIKTPNIENPKQISVAQNYLKGKVKW